MFHFDETEKLCFNFLRKHLFFLKEACLGDCGDFDNSAFFRQQKIKSQNLDWLWAISGTQWNKLIKYKKKKVRKHVNKSPENYHKGILTLKGPFVDSTLSIMILLLVLNLQGSEAELLGSNIKYWEKTKVSHCCCAISPLSLFLFCIPALIWKH